MTQDQAKQTLLRALRALSTDCQRQGEQTGALIALEATLAHGGQHANRVWRILDLWFCDSGQADPDGIDGLEARLLALRWYDLDLTA
jgi:hypothetical protein